MTSALSEFDVYRPTILAVARACGLLPWPPAMANVATTADATMGSYGQYRIEADITGPASPTLFHRLAASYDQDMHCGEPYDAHASNFSPSLLWQPDERVSVSLRHENFRKTETPQLMQKPGYNTQAGVVPTASDPNPSGVDVPGLAHIGKNLTHQSYRPSQSTRGRRRECLLAFASSF